MQEADLPESSSRGRLREDGRRKRTYWGRARHADLVVSETGEVVSGPGDALIHEMVFATTFLKKNPDDPPSPEIDPNWKDFATAVLLCLPTYMDKAKFEAEVLRDLNSYDRGASEDEKRDNAPRMQWILTEYLRLHGSAQEDKEWRALIIQNQPEPSPPPPATLARPQVERGASGDSIVVGGRSKLGVILSEEGMTRDTFSRLEPRKMSTLR